MQLRQKNELGVYLMNLTVSDLLYLASLPLWLQYIFQVNASASSIADVCASQISLGSICG